MFTLTVDTGVEPLPTEYGPFASVDHAEKYRDRLKDTYIALMGMASFEIAEADAEFMEFAKAEADRPRRTKSRDWAYKQR